MSANSTSASRGVRTIKKPLRPSPAIWPKRRTGCSRTSNHTANPLARGRRFRPRRRKRRMRLSPPRLANVIAIRLRNLLMPLRDETGSADVLGPESASKCPSEGILRHCPGAETRSWSLTGSRAFSDIGVRAVGSGLSPCTRVRQDGEDERRLDRRSAFRDDASDFPARRRLRNRRPGPRHYPTRAGSQEDAAEVDAPHASRHPRPRCTRCGRPARWIRHVTRALLRP